MNDPAPIPVIPTLSSELRRHIDHHRSRTIGHVALLHFGRSGSRDLEDRLSASIDVVTVDRPAKLEDLRGRCPEPPQRVLASLALGHARGVGPGYEPLLRGLERLGFTQFVLLTRRNYLRAVVSCHLDEQPVTGRVPLDPDAVEIDGECRSLRSLFAQWDRDRAEIQARLHGRRRLELSYEDDVEEDPTWACLWVRDFLGIAQAPVPLRVGPRASREIQHAIDGYDEIQAHLDGTRWAWMAPPTRTSGRTCCRS